MERRFHLGKYDKRLWTRVRAREIRKDLLALLEDSGVGDVFVIDLDGVEVFDISFANEFFGRTVLDLPKSYQGRFIVLENLNEFTRENLETALRNLGLVMIERKSSGINLIGKVHPVDKETFEAIAAAKEPVTSTYLKERLGTNLTAMNERLKKLSELGIIRRESGVSPSGREQFLYSVFD